MFVRAIAIGEKTLGPEHPDVAVCLTNLARVLSFQVGAFRVFGDVLVASNCRLFVVVSGGRTLTIFHWFARTANALRPSHHSIGGRRPHDREREVLSIPKLRRRSC